MILKKIRVFLILDMLLSLWSANVVNQHGKYPMWKCIFVIYNTF